MKVVNVEFVENEMVELDVVQIGQIEVECGDENGYWSGECGNEGGDGYAEETSPAAIPLPPLHPPLHPLPNQSKPIVPITSFSLSFPLITSRYTLITSSYNSITFSYNYFISIISSYISISFSYVRHDYLYQF